MSLVPSLLVSVRSTAEAEAALAGGAALIDVKEPAHGPLGRAAAETVAAVVRVVAGRRLVSAALGEFVKTPELPEVRGLAFVKWGLSACQQALPDWPRRLATAAYLVAQVVPGCRLVAVAYADWKRAAAPPPRAICEFACRYGCGAFLLDTFFKGRKNLLEYLPLERIHGLVQRCREAGVRVALAGSLGPDEIATLAPVRPDWFAVRGAVCQGGHRKAAVDADAVRRLVEHVRAATAAN
jgi:uncharacterized protein (UPF0264 family)